jgi:hypothetical protein
MATEIAQSEWKPFLTDFSQRHRGAQVEIDAIGTDGIRPETSWLPFAGIAIDTDGKIEIWTGDGALTHTVMRPRAIYHKHAAGELSNEVTRNEVLEITSDDDPPITYLRFRKAG